jgi:4-amino-4-deoxy-L-arabinose transferase-like glycosyltransferase
LYSPTVPSRVLLALGLLLFGLPLFIGLGRTDLENDEAIYSYSVERMVALHDWLTPRGIYDGADNPFLEKPPLKTWVVAAGQLAGLPSDEFGLRFFDPLFAIGAFAYVFALGRRLAGPVCGLIALLMLFTFQPLVFVHGVRTNNMEAALLLTYCGGIYHLFRWIEDGPDRGRRHAWFVAAYFAFGFLTKFVAALFLPLVAGIATAWRRDSAQIVRSRAREWTWPIAAACAVIAPWFLYQTVIRGLSFWREILGNQIVTRFTSGLDPGHLRPWHFYVTRTFDSFRDVSAATVVIVGIAVLAHRAWQGRTWLPRLILVWWIVPYVLISAGTSKLFHYAYPFVPPIALGAGLAATAWVDLWNTTASRWRLASSRLPAVAARPWLENTIVVAASILFVLAYMTAVEGPLTWRLFGVRVLRNTSAIRPLVAALVVLGGGASIRAAVRATAVTLLVITLPVAAYFRQLPQLVEMHRPLHAIRDCVVRQTSDVARRDGVYGPDWQTAGHSFFYYFRSIGPYHANAHAVDEELGARLFQPSRQTPVVLLKSQRPLWRDATTDTKLAWLRFAAIEIGPYVVVLPGSYGVCASDATSAGGQLFSLVADQ